MTHSNASFVCNTNDRHICMRIYMCILLIHIRHVLQCVAGRCSVLQGVAVCCRALQCVAGRCSVLICGRDLFICACVCLRCFHVADLQQCVVPGHDTRECVLQCVAVCCSVLQCVAVCCSALQCVAVC